MQKMYPLKKEG